jgi:allophanate hydrolase subunit 2
MIRIERALGLVTVQDLGAHGRMHEAIPPGGALVPDLAVRANRLAHNPDDACVIEVLGKLVVRAATDLLVATDERSFFLQKNETCEIASHRHRAAYFAVRGGLAASRTLLCAGGSVLRAGDELSVGTLPERHATPPSLELGEVRIIAGPDAFERSEIDKLVSAPYRILGASDRTGTRLRGPKIRVPDAPERSRPMVCGAIEVCPDSDPIVLGPEHPTTGGYPVIAVIATEHRSRFFAIPLGGEVRFALG